MRLRADGRRSQGRWRMWNPFLSLRHGPIETVPPHRNKRDHYVLGGARETAFGARRTLLMAIRAAIRRFDVRKAILARKVQVSAHRHPALARCLPVRLPSRLEKNTQGLRRKAPSRHSRHSCESPAPANRCSATVLHFSPFLEDRQARRYVHSRSAKAPAFREGCRR
jgi:hypothetical protein